MKRIAIHLLLALTLILQGTVGAFAAVSAQMIGHHCGHATPAGHAAVLPDKCPCCPDGVMGGCADVCTACGMAFVVPALLRIAKIEHLVPIRVNADASVRVLSNVPPTPPPIA
ncbi:MAG TPA: hypothetical protein VIE67_03855 [Rudaea sp.]|jgi:hypothetical protein|uniref:hypothetical protein n=1 Tax=Rudaea sp. TaxID=2136325 RepID=UPI002F93FC48